MRTVNVTFNDSDIRCYVELPNGEQKEFWQVSAMLNWCAENDYEPLLVESEVMI